MTSREQIAYSCSTGHNRKRAAGLHRKRIHLLLLLVAFLVLPVARIQADGCFVSKESVALQAPEQKVVISWDGNRQVMVLATRVRASEIADFGWIIPVKTDTPPQVELADTEVFDHLKDYFLPVPKTFTLLGAGAPGSEIELIETKDLGIYRVTIVRATDSHAFSAWLQANGFSSNQALEDVLGSYRLEDFFFVLAQIDLSIVFKDDIDFVRRQAMVADVTSLDGKAIKALAALRWPTGDQSLAELVTEDILAARPYRSSSLASNPLNRIYNLIGPEDYEKLLARHFFASDEPKAHLTETLSERLYDHESVQPFVRIENIFTDLEAGVANPLKITCTPKAPFFPMRISSANAGSVAIVAYVLADQPVADAGKILKAEVWKPVSDDLRRDISGSLDATHASCLTKLTFVGESSAFTQDIDFQPMEDDERKRLFEERQIVHALLYWPMSGYRADDVRRILDEHPRASEFLDRTYILEIVKDFKQSRVPAGDAHDSAATTISMLRAFLDHGFQIDTRAPRGANVVHLLVGWPFGAGDADREVLTFVLDAGAQINAKDAMGKTPLDYVFDDAQKHSDDYLERMALLLIRRGGTLAQLDRKDLGRIKGHFAKTVLPAAKEAGNTAIVNLLIRGNAVDKRRR